MSRLTQVLEAEGRGDLAFLHHALTDADPAVRRVALGALGRRDDLEDRTIADALTDDDTTVVLRGIELVVDRVAGHRTSPARVQMWAERLTESLEEADDLIVEQAAWALGEFPDTPASAVTALVSTAQEHEVSICREAAVAALGAIGDVTGLPAILAAMDDRAPVRRRAVLALAPFEGPDVDDALDRALRDRDRQVRQAAEDLR